MEWSSTMNLEDDIKRGEGYGLEFKLVPNEERIKYLKTVVAFANGKGGSILFGVANDGTVQGLDKAKVFAEMDGITDSIANACSPRIPIDIGIEDVGGKSIIVLDVLAGSRCPYFLKAEGDKDGVYVRVGATTQRADDATRHELALEAEGRSFDSEPCPGAKIDDKRIAALCSYMYRIARRNSRNETERRAVKKVTANQLQAWGIISKVRNRWVASNAYALLTGDGAFSTRVKCGVFKGDTKAVFVDRREFTGPVYGQIEEAHKYILAKINMGCVFEGIQRNDLYELPPDALRELVVNAFAHRNYFEHGAPVFVAVYDTRVEIVSPGGLPRGLTVEKALSGRSKIRNHALAEAFNYMKVIEQWGSGLKRVAEELAAYGARPLQLEDGGIDVRLNVLRNPALGEKPDIGGQKQHIEGRKQHIGGSKQHIGLKEPHIDGSKFRAPTLQHIGALYAALKEAPAFGRKDVCRITGLTPRVASTLVSKMLSHKVIVPVAGHGKGAYRFV
jgi:predicted HTH transcriptional regulator